MELCNLPKAHSFTLPTPFSPTSNRLKLETSRNNNFAVIFDPISRWDTVFNINNVQQLSWIEIWLTKFCCSTIPQKHFFLITSIINSIAFIDAKSPGLYYRKFLSTQHFHSTMGTQSHLYQPSATLPNSHSP